MGVNFLVCAACSDTFPDCGKYVTCNDALGKVLKTTRLKGFRDGQEKIR